MKHSGRRTAIAILAFLSCHATVHAQVLYTDIEPDKVLAASFGQFVTFDLDLDGDGSVDYFFKHWYVPAPAYTADIHTKIGTDSEVLVVDTRKALALPDESLICEDPGPWYCTASGGTTSALDLGSGWRGNGDLYVGLRIRRGSEWHYGWVRLSVAADLTSMVLKDYAWETRPNECIRAGDTGTMSAQSPPRPRDITAYFNGGELFIDSPDQVVRLVTVFDTNGGRRVSWSGSSCRVQLNIGTLPRGAYFLLVKSATSTRVLRLPFLP